MWNALDAKSTLSPGDGQLVVSVVSHGHGALVQSLLVSLARRSATTVSRVVLTQNLPEAEPEPPEQGWPFLLQILKNSTPAGFGANHNRALVDAMEPFVCVLNPDVGLEEGDPFAALVMQASQPGVGCSYPWQVDSCGRPQDHERELPTPSALWRRRVLGHREGRVDWVNAACLVVPQSVWRALNGFDEGYFMYCEDVDLCLRMRLAGWALARTPVRIVHGGQRDSRRRWNHLRWHLASLLRLWRSPVYRQASEWLRSGQFGASNIRTS